MGCQCTIPIPPIQQTPTSVLEGLKNVSLNTGETFGPRQFFVIKKNRHGSHTQADIMSLISRVNVVKGSFRKFILMSGGFKHLVTFHNCYVKMPLKKPGGVSIAERSPGNAVMLKVIISGVKLRCLLLCELEVSVSPLLRIRFDMSSKLSLVLL